MRVSRGLNSNNNSSTISSSRRIFRQDSTTNNKSGTFSRLSAKQPPKKPLSVQYSNAGKYPKSSIINSRKSRQQKTNFFDTIIRFREKLVELLVNIQLKILDFILEPVERLFPTSVMPPIRNRCTGSCCRAPTAHLPANRSQSASILSIKGRPERRHLFYSMKRRTVSENWNF